MSTKYHVFIVNTESASKYNYTFSKPFLVFAVVLFTIVLFISSAAVIISAYYFKSIPHYENMAAENKFLRENLDEYNKMTKKVEKLITLQNNLLKTLEIHDFTVDKITHMRFPKEVEKNEKDYMNFLVRKKFNNEILLPDSLKDNYLNFQWPIHGIVTKYFELTGKDGNPHLGIDIVSDVNAYIYAASDGVVSKTGYNTVYGNYIELTHKNGFKTFYAHNNRNLCSLGMKVKKGELIAFLGNTGKSSGPHLHFEIIKDGRNVSPFEFLF